MTEPVVATITVQVETTLAIPLSWNKDYRLPEMKNKTARDKSSIFVVKLLVN